MIENGSYGMASYRLTVEINSMQINKKGQIINAPIYRIYGDERRSLKKKYAALKNQLKMFWLMEDMNRVYGYGMTDAEAEYKLHELKTTIAQMEATLKEPFISQK